MEECSIIQLYNKEATVVASFYLIGNCVKPLRHDYVMPPPLSGEARFVWRILAPLKGELSLKATEGLKCVKHTFLLYRKLRKTKRRVKLRSENRTA